MKWIILPVQKNAMFSIVHIDALLEKQMEFLSISRDCNKKLWNKQLRWNTNWVHALL